MPFGRAGKKREVTQGVVQPPESGATYNGKPIPPDYALVDVVWVNPDFEHEELDFQLKGKYFDRRCSHFARAMEQGRHHVGDADAGFTTLVPIVIPTG
jgi:hypothetical protein